MLDPPEVLLLVLEEPIEAGLIEELMEAPIAAALPKFRGIIVLGSKGSWLATAPATEGESVAARPPFAEESAASLAVALAGCADPVAAVPVPVSD